MDLLTLVVVAVVLYCCASYVFLRFPIQAKGKGLPFLDHVEFATICHRGGGGENPENSLAAFRHGSKHGEMLELDVRLTKDGVVVIMHDPDFSNLSGSSQKVCDTLYEDLPLIHGKEKMCTLQELLDDPECESSPICLDFKIGERDIIEQVYEMFKKKKRLNRLVWGSFSEQTRKRLYREHPEIPTFCSLGETVYLYIAFLLGFLPFIKIESSFLASVLMREEWLEKFIRTQNHGLVINTIFKLINAVGGLALFIALIENPKFVRHLEKRGTKVAFWTANTVEDLVRVKRSNASGYVTDFPSHKLHLKADGHKK